MLRSLNDKVDEVIGRLAYARVDDYTEIVLDGRFTLDQLRHIVDVLEAGLTPPGAAI